MRKSLLADIDNLPIITKESLMAAPNVESAGLFIPLDQIQPDPDQPRKLSGGDDEELTMLADSILQHGIIQPITVQRLPDNTYQIVAGERRWRAAKLALQSGTKCQRKGYDLNRIPVFIRNPENDVDKLEMQMVENLARAGMSDEDIGAALNKLLEATKVSKAELARRLGRSNTWVSAILSKASPEALAVAERIGVDPKQIGTGESMRLVSWYKDNEKRVVLDWIAEDLSAGRPFSRSVLDDAESRYEILRRFPNLATRTDLTLDDLKMWKGFWDSTDGAQRAIADRVLEGMGLSEAMQAPRQPDGGVPLPASDGAPADTDEAGMPDGGNVWMPPETDAGWMPEESNAGGNAGEMSSDTDAHTDESEDGMPDDDGYAGGPNDDFDIDEREAEDVQAARIAASPEKPIKTPTFTSEDRANVDAAGLQMESGKGFAPVATQDNPDIHIRVPGDLVHLILERAGISDDLTVDADTVLGAIRVLVG